MANWVLPDAGDILWCRFPEYDAFKPAAKLRPALVLEVLESATGILVLVAYGTSQKTDTLYPGEFLIEKADHDAWRLCGLRHTTKFDLGRTVRVYYNRDWFAPPPYGRFAKLPKLGTMHPMYWQQAMAARSRVRS